MGYSRARHADGVAELRAINSHSSSVDSASRDAIDSPIKRPLSKLSTVPPAPRGSRCLEHAEDARPVCSDDITILFEVTGSVPRWRAASQLTRMPHLRSLAAAHGMRQAEFLVPSTKGVRLPASGRPRVLLRDRFIAAILAFCRRVARRGERLLYSNDSVMEILTASPILDNSSSLEPRASYAYSPCAATFHEAPTRLSLEPSDLGARPRGGLSPLRSIAPGSTHCRLLNLERGKQTRLPLVPQFVRQLLRSHLSREPRERTPLCIHRKRGPEHWVSLSPASPAQGTSSRDNDTMPPPRAFQPVRRPKGGPPSTVMTLAPLSEEAESTDFTLPITPKALSAAGRQAKEEVDEEWHAASSGIQQVSDKLTAIVELASKQGDSPSALAAWQVAFVADYRAAGGTNWVLRNALDKLDKALQVVQQRKRARLSRSLILRRRID